MLRIARCNGVILLVFLWPCHGLFQGPVGAAEMQEDVRVLDSLFMGHEILNGNNLVSLNSRDTLMSVVQDGSLQSRLSWALLLHQWLRSSNDAHIRVRFELLADSLTTSLPPVPDEMLDAGGHWEGFAPGPGSAQCARLSWMNRTWPWVGALLPDAEVFSRSNEPAAQEGPVLHAGMAVVDHGAFTRWVIRDFSSGTPSAFKRSFRRCIRALAKAKTPVLLDVRGNLGGFRTRRHAVLSFFLPPSEWPEEREVAFSGPGQPLEAVIPCMPALRVSKRHAGPVAVLVDGLSFSASLLLADAIVMSGRGQLFGVQPLGQSGGCSGSPVDHMLPGSGLVVTCPTLRTSIGAGPAAPYDLVDDGSTRAGDRAWRDAVRWLLSADLDSPR